MMNFSFKFNESEVRIEHVIDQIEPTVFSLYALYVLYNTQPLSQSVKVNINIGKFAIIRI